MNHPPEIYTKDEFVRLLFDLYNLRYWIYINHWRVALPYSHLYQDL